MKGKNSLAVRDREMYVCTMVTFYHDNQALGGLGSDLFRCPPEKGPVPAEHAASIKSLTIMFKSWHRPTSLACPSGLEPLESNDVLAVYLDVA